MCLGKKIVGIVLLVVSLILILSGYINCRSMLKCVGCDNLSWPCFYVFLTLAIVSFIIGIILLSIKNKKGKKRKK